MASVVVMKRYLPFFVAGLFVLAGCGTVVPGPRYRVNVDEFSFTSDGGGVVYGEDRLRYYPFLLGFREGHDLYLYNRKSREHRHIARADAFSVSPFAPRILYSPEWDKRFKERDGTPDFYLFDYESGERRGFFMPAGFDRGYLSYGFPYVEWEKEGSLTAYVNFVYCPGGKPRSWKWQWESPPHWHAKRWKVRIDPSLEGDRVAEAVAWDVKRLPAIPWSEVHRRRFMSPDGREELVFSKYNGYYTFNTTLSIEGLDNPGNEYVVREHRLVNIVQMGKYIVYYVGAAPMLGLNLLLR
jgi:hypothetical protein